jgi:hypothetical protein
MKYISIIPGNSTHQQSRFIHQYVEEYDSLKKARRPGRPASTREDLLKSKVAALQAEYDQGFCKLPIDLAICAPCANPCQLFQMLSMLKVPQF